ncbi:MAG: CIA30 family protein [bacterium]|jgi:monofunctional biosynthetic peptidoglycan transglycosylase|tara:strand:+ start:276 stop:878 length:603 start_codon:yes stop_codon:yes gene_type:complete
MLVELVKNSHLRLHRVRLILLLLFFVPTMEIQSAASIKLLLNFRDINDSGRWMVVNDGVMGGVSRSTVNLHNDGYLIFAGNVSTDYGGGFASIRTDYKNWGIGKHEGLILRVKGDGKTYQFRCRLGNNMNQIAYRHYFQTNNDEWQEIILPFKEFLPTYRGRVLNNFAVLDPNQIKHLGVMISDKQVGDFKLEIDWIGVY